MYFNKCWPLLRKNKLTCYLLFFLSYLSLYKNMLYFQQFQELWQEIPEEFGFTAGPLEDDCKFLLFVSSKRLE